MPCVTHDKYFSTVRKGYKEEKKNTFFVQSYTNIKVNWFQDLRFQRGRGMNV